MSCQYGKAVYEGHKFPQHPEMRLSAGDGTREVFTCNNCCLATKVVFTVTRDGVKTVSELVVEPK